METGYNRFGPQPEWEGEPQEFTPRTRAQRAFEDTLEEIREREVSEPKSVATGEGFWRVILGGLHQEYVDRFDEAGYRGDPDFRPLDS